MTIERMAQVHKILSSSHITMILNWCPAGHLRPSTRFCQAPGALTCQQTKLMAGADNYLTSCFVIEMQGDLLSCASDTKEGAVGMHM